MQRLHHGEVPIDLALARRLVTDQHPQLADRPVRVLSMQGTDNVLFRLGEDLYPAGEIARIQDARLPRARRRAGGLGGTRGCGRTCR